MMLLSCPTARKETRPESNCAFSDPMAMYTTVADVLDAEIVMQDAR
jgi:hypothetical protein